MAYYPDLTRYEYNAVKRGDPSKTLNVGWLDCRHPFETAPPIDWLIEKLWAHCLFAVDDKHGFHECDLRKCTWHKRYRAEVSDAPFISLELLRQLESAGKSPHPDYATVADYRRAREVTKTTYRKTMITVCRHRRKENLGYSEIRIMGENDIVYAAPNLVFHYLTAHHYKMPDEVIAALKHGPCPPEQEYFDRLRLTGTTLSMIQCFKRVRRAHLRKHERRSVFGGIWDIPTGPVKWIPELRPRPVGRVPRPGVKP